MSVKVQNIHNGFEYVSKRGEDAKPFIDINESFKKIAGGKDLCQLLEEGRVFNMNGEPIGIAGRKVKIDGIVPAFVSFACEAMKENGIMILDEKSGNRPRHVYFDVKKDLSGKPESMDMYASDPLSQKDLPGYYNSIAVSAKQGMEVPVKPGFFNRLRDGFSRFWGGEGTPEMNDYRAEMKKYESRLGEINKLREGHKMLETRVTDAPKLKKDQENRSMIEKAVSESKLGYEPNSKEWGDDYIIYSSFQSAIKDLAGKNADVMKLVVGMGADGSIKQLYDAYKAGFGEEGKTLADKKAEFQKMLKDTVDHASNKGKETEKVPAKATEALSKSGDVQKLPG